MKYSWDDQINLALLFCFAILTTDIYPAVFWIMLIRYGWLIANYHRGFTSNSYLVIWLLGMPGIPIRTTDQDYVSFLSAWCDIVIPEYYWFGRSDGDFTPDGCLQTVIDTYNYFKKWWTIKDIWSKEEVIVTSYQEIIIIGNSFGAAFASRVVQQLPEVTTIWFISWAIEYSNMNQIWYIEETVDEIMRVLDEWGFAQMYRSATSNIRDIFYQDQRWQWYDEIIQDLSHKSIFIVHGDADESVHVSRSRKLYGQLQSINPLWNYQYLEIPKWWHWWITKQIGVIEFCKWLNWR